MAEYYVSPNGSNAGTGAIGDPWQTLAYSFSQLSAGDTLWCRGGTYPGNFIQWTPAGTSEAPIVVRAYPGETPILDGGYQAFREPGNSDWELIDAENDIWQSVGTYTVDSSAVPMGFFEDTEGTGQRYRLLYYPDSSFTWTHGDDGPYYQGPGAHWDSESGKLMVCLRQPTDGVFIEPFYIPANTDPRANRIWLSGARYGIYLKDGSSNIVFDGLDIWLYERGIMGIYAITNFTYKNATMHVGRDGIQFSGGAVNGMHFVNNVVRGYKPPWWPWFLHKDRSTQETSAVRVRDPYPVTNVLIANNDVDGVYDVFKWSDQFDGIIIANTVTNIGDDALQMGPDNDYVEVCYNLFTHGSGIGWTNAGSPDNGEAWFIHNNVMRSDTVQWRFGDATKAEDLTPFTRHGTVTNFPSKIYRNTLINGHASGAGTAHQTINETEHLHEVFNNIMFFDYETSTRACVRLTAWADKEVRDFNLYHNLTPPLFLQWRAAIGEALYSYNTLDLWRGSAQFTASQAVYAPGLEANSIQAPPLLADSVGGDFRLTPQSPALGAAVDLRDKTWPMNRLYPRDHIGAMLPNDTRPSVGRGYLPRQIGLVNQFVTVSGNRQYLIFDTQEEAQAAADAIADAMRQEVADADPEIRAALAQGAISLNEVGLSASGLTTSWAAPRLLTAGEHSGKYAIPLPSQESRTWLRDAETGAVLYHTAPAFENATVAAI